MWLSNTCSGNTVAILCSNDKYLSVKSLKKKVFWTVLHNIMTAMLLQGSFVGIILWNNFYRILSCLLMGLKLQPICTILIYNPRNLRH